MRYLSASTLLILSLGCQATAVNRWVAGKEDLRAGDHESAILHLSACTRQDPDFAPAYLALAAACSKQGDFPAVADNLEKYLERNPKHGVAHLYLAECLFQMNDDERSRDHYLQFIQRVLGEEPTDHDRLIHCYQRMVELAERRGDPFEEELYTGLAIFQRGFADRFGRPPESNSTRSPDASFAAALDRFNKAKAYRPNDPVLRRAIDEVLGEVAVSDGFQPSRRPSGDEPRISNPPFAPVPRSGIDPGISSLLLESSKQRR